QASPIPCPAPVITAVLPSSLNFSRYMTVFPYRLALRQNGRDASGVNRIAGIVEAVDARRVGRQRDLIARGDAHFADGPRGQCSDGPGIDVKEGVAAKMLGHHHFPGPALPVALDLEMLRPYANGRGAVFLGGVARDEIHLRRADEAGDEQIGRLLVKLERRAILLDLSGI